MNRSGPTAAVLRLLSDLKGCQDEGFNAGPVNEDNLFVWNATLFGPYETAWEGGVFQLKLVFSEEYPQKPPKVKFMQTVYHPNVFGDGSLCLDIIQDKWTPVYSVASLLTSITSLFTDPNPDSPANPEAARLFVSDKKEYNKRVRACVERTLEE
ncbi:ubiquitinconjugating enzyme E2-17 kDa, putative [Acanthamoeba castellanii str. Neff]|uniref:Ubiquitinconjugating enzyme E2-17 kDa, putative n=1 Tax=Acanthamoeba castellanii (strain ATCC 30010 / Neff) TaxID=1257118 RepID=L8GWJ5_ACACF|nr:ubiquitinconjugating enzyme E2-17 kDa, putative [Acanthamoeba castellanii str. Neff]ELR16963.1 ubiquitinconjugating enzyme E2-17 kDa, putative [Acanthamoeba castellanii str. Neff]